MVQTEVLRVHPTRPAAAKIKRAAAVLRQGGLVAFPTETVYGLGANALDEKAVARIFAAKGRPAYDPLIVHLATPEELPRVVREVPELAWTLARAFWPGPLTLVLPKAPNVPPNVTAGRHTVAVRVPSHPVAAALLRAADLPVAAPSANRFGHTSPTTAAHVLEDLNGRVDLVLDAGPTPVGVESTVLDLTAEEPTVLRPGGVSIEALAAVLGRPPRLAHPTVVEGAEVPAEGLASPGMLAKHYAPHAELWLLLGPQEAVLAEMRRRVLELACAGRRVGLLVADEDRARLEDVPAVLVSVGSVRRPAVIARRLYTALRELDRRAVEVILARDFGSAGLALAVRDRLLRASGGRVVWVEHEEGKTG
jgi:L-threonylcarbamoyladenylate synthase